MTLALATTSAPQPPAQAWRAIDLVVIHCSATPSGKWLGVQPWPQHRISPNKVIDAWHAARGFARSPQARAAFHPELAAIGYHHVIDIDGAVYPGRHASEVGAHVAGHNANSIGICMVGGAEPVAAYTTLQWMALATLVRTLLQAHPGARVVGHRDLSPDLNHDGTVGPNEWLKTCPGFSVSEWVLQGSMPLLAQTVQPKSVEPERA